ncbi:MAG: zinc ribbon domain-containing protein [Chloroflexota bacterium]|nr:zinc ribbon domain-containing protein [Chloroflexota bacterium]
MTNTLLEQGISAALTGRRDEARALLTQVVEADDRNEQAWLWLSGLLEEPEDMRTCLENVLHLNPDNVKAQQGLAWVEQRHGARLVADVATIDASPVQSALSAGDSALPAEPLPRDMPDPSAVLVVAELEPINDACPYCGTAAPPETKRCPSCGKQLMQRAEGTEKRSKALTTLGGLWSIGGIFSLLGAALVVALLVMLQRNGSFYGITSASLAKSGVSTASLYSRLLGGVIYGVLQLVMAHNLLQRKRWAWIVTAILQVLQLLAALLIVVFFAVISRVVLAGLPGGPSQSGSPLGSVFLVVVILVLFIPQIIALLLLFFSYGDVFAPMQRQVLRLDVVSPATHYNNGLDYKNRGMWYMAAQEWATAVKHAPLEPNFLHALGLAFVQLKQFDRARITLDFARQIAPDDTAIVDSRALADQIEKRGGRW